MSMTSILKFNSDSITAGSMGADITGTPFDVAEATIVSLHSVWSAGSTPIGALIVEASNDGVVFTSIDSQSVSGDSGSLMYNSNVVGYRYIRAFYDRTSGSGTLSVKICAKG